jgi:hypothetical protein
MPRLERNSALVTYVAAMYSSLKSSPGARATKPQRIIT